MRRVQRIWAQKSLPRASRLLWQDSQLLLQPQRRLLSTAAQGAGTSWGRRAAALSLPVATFAGIYMWRHWGGASIDDGSSFADSNEVPRAHFDKKYELKRSLGKGGFGEVWLAVERSSGRQVAVKVPYAAHSAQSARATELAGSTKT